MRAGETIFEGIRGFGVRSVLERLPLLYLHEREQRRYEQCKIFEGVIVLKQKTICQQEELKTWGMNSLAVTIMVSQLLVLTTTG